MGRPAPMIYDARRWLARIGTVALPCAVASAPADARAQLPAPPDLAVYVGRGCPHCARALEWVETG